MKIGAIIQARMGSTRLSGKVMKPLKGKTILSHVIERVKQSEKIDNIIIATTVLDRDDIIEQEATREGVSVFRGSEEDVLSRYYYAAKEKGIDLIIRITSDCPLIDPIIVDEMIDYYLENQYDIVTNASNNLSLRTYPRGLDTEIFPFSLLENAFFNAKQKHQREHVTPFLYENSSNVYYYKNEVDYSGYRWTLDTEEDFLLIAKVYDAFYKGVHDFYLKDIITLFEREPELTKINEHIEQKKIK